MIKQDHITPQFFFYLRKYIHCLLSPHFYSLIFLAKFSYTFSTFNLLLKWHSFPFPQFLSSWYLFIFFLFCGKKMISTRNILFIFAIFCAQLYIFTQVQSVELRFALAVVAIFQIWKKTYYNNKPAADGRFILSRNTTKNRWTFDNNFQTYSRLLEGWRQPVRFTNFLAEIRFCCFGSPL